MNYIRKKGQYQLYSQKFRKKKHENYGRVDYIWQPCNIEKNEIGHVENLMVDLG